MKASFLLSAVVLCGVAHALEVDVEDFGAKADNQTLSSVGINAALQHVSSNGGGVVHARAKGAYRVARIEMKSHTELRIDPDSVLYASDRAKDWTDRTVEVPAQCGGAGIVQNGTRGGVFFAVRREEKRSDEKPALCMKYYVLRGCGAVRGVRCAVCGAVLRV